ncbi:hypothetical protein CONCODRAFT_3482 [Conidiobolus coronatus NRRL 28638]|uniref:Uncharacterized protein n=1 Tax=Conidiobolus coronatus (strain ATCC 28846 / CBS 209.66 / NRRL 28638) TaxID=796925 RepID=A0A137PET9_CONC2|nr:hypothetical protein CONCODRAFT_3482 [Conidiobolus coronatus NRRL 28638]|eukprot:KXN73524.1 hypothetical protein CONCODRAFT_3482 [Conidiobolus coronatus NRRL 28638]
MTIYDNNRFQIIYNHSYNFYLIYSTNDPIFYLQNTYFDNTWYQWQSIDESRFDEYNSYKENVSKNDQLIGLSGTIIDVLDPRNDSGWYKYEPWSANVNLALENSSIIQYNQRFLGNIQEGNIWNLIEALPFKDEDEEIMGIKQLISRSEKCLISKIRKMSLEALKMMNMNPELFKANRRMSVKMINIINANSNYIPEKDCRQII